MTEPKNKPIPLRLSAELLEKLAEASRLTGLTQADILRLTIAIGLEDLRKVNFNLAKILSDAAEEVRTTKDLKLVAAQPLLEQEPSSPATGSGFWLDMVGGVAAGSPISSDCHPKAVEVPESYDADTHRVWKVFGRSMEPKIKDGALIIGQLLAEGTFPKQGTIVVYEDAYGASLKEFAYRKAKPGEEANVFGKVPVLKSLNPAYPAVDTLESGRLVAVYVGTV